jgi:membrane protein YqaA with SNARE-associated domain
MPPFSGSRDDWLRRAEAFSNSSSGTALLALIAFADSSVLPVLPDLLLVPMLLLRPERTLLLTAVCVVASSVGAVAGYAIGHLAWSAFGHALVEMYGQQDNFQYYQQLVENWGVWIIIAKSFTPIPFKFIAIAAGLASMDLKTFIFAAIAGRALHFAVVAVLVAYLGPKLPRLIEGFQKYGRWSVGLGIAAAVCIGIVRLLR